MKAKRYSIGSQTLPGLSKVVEEMGELGTILGKIIGIGHDREHWDGQNLHQRSIEEMADVAAAILFYAKHNFTPAEQHAYLARIEEKAALFDQWHGARKARPSLDFEVSSPGSVKAGDVLLRTIYSGEEEASLYEVVETRDHGFFRARRLPNGAPFWTFTESAAHRWVKYSKTVIQDAEDAA